MTKSIEEIKKEYQQRNVVMTELIRNYDIPKEDKIKLILWAGEEEYLTSSDVLSDSETNEIRAYAIAICDKFENLLDKHNIKIPDEDREGNEEEACIYGMTYAKLEEEIMNVLNVLVCNVINAKVSNEERK